jgi:hypothetical protein
VDEYLAEIRLFAGMYEPRGWMFCDGRLLSIAQNLALFSLLGTTYGGDGVNTFALPDLRGRVPVGAGAGPGLTPRALGETDQCGIRSQRRRRRRPCLCHGHAGYHAGRQGHDPNRGQPAAPEHAAGIGLELYHLRVRHLSEPRLSTTAQSRIGRAPYQPFCGQNGRYGARLLQKMAHFALDK